jgi:molecular chaperone HtpG
VINSNHRMIQKVLNASDEGDKIKIAKQAYDLALLSQGLLKGTDLTNFIQRSVELGS